MFIGKRWYAYGQNLLIFFLCFEENYQISTGVQDAENTHTIFEDTIENDVAVLGKTS